MSTEVTINELNNKLNEGRDARTREMWGRFYIYPSQPIVCEDGFSISIQCSETAYCEPRLNLPDVSGYESFELGYPSELDSLIEEYAETVDTTETVFPYVPRKVVEALIAKHGGIQ